jgi:hypothetical protein
MVLIEYGIPGAVEQNRRWTAWGVTLREKGRAVFRCGRLGDGRSFPANQPGGVRCGALSEAVIELRTRHFELWLWQRLFRGD